ncbi:MAG: MotA/TolQ/ExbB proton channel family protein [Elusimicrobia bacterium]|nr:MotA/TolQ/ExbB proton channel family protein [Elusimicrobiota bacterium]
MNLYFLKRLALTGGDWVIYGLLLCSAVALAVMIERAIVLRREMRQLDALNDAFLKGIKAGEVPELEETVRRHPGAASRILQAGLTQAQHGAAGVEDHLVAASFIEKRRLERRLLILGTLGNNAPFIGLFGTVLGVIQAFHDLSQSGSGPEVVMQGLSEALVATAVGLFVAIPCVVGFNYFSKNVRDLLGQTESLGRILLAHIRTEKADRAR